MKALLWLAVRSRRLWLLAGVPVAALVALSSVAHVSLLPFAAKDKNLAFATARTQLDVLPPGQLVNAPPSAYGASDPTNSTAQATVLANLLTSPELRAGIARAADIEPRYLAVDGPIPGDQPLAQIEPAGEKRANQITTESDPYRITVDMSQSLPVMGITVKAPTTGTAVRIAAATRTALRAYLSSLATQAKLPAAQRIDVQSLAGIDVTGRSSAGVASVAALVFVLSLVLWTGAVYAFAAVARDLRIAPQQRPRRASLRPEQPLNR